MHHAVIYSANRIIAKIYICLGKLFLKFIDFRLRVLVVVLLCVGSVLENP